MIKLIIFDFDGVVIIGSNEGYINCYHQALAAVGVTLAPDEERRRILARWGKGYKQQLELLLEEHPQLLTKAIGAYEHFYHDTDAFEAKIRLVPGAKETLEQLSKSYILAIASGMMRKSMEKLLERFSLSDYFKHVFTIDDVTELNHMKPSPFMVHKIMKLTNNSPHEALVIGDAKGDMVMAKAANVIPVAVLTGHLTKSEAEHLGIKYIVSDITKLDTVLREVNK